MAEQKIYTHLDGNKNELRNWSIEKLAADPTGADLYAGRFWENAGTIKYFDGTAVKTVATLAGLTSIGTFQGAFDASNGIPTTTLDGSPIVAGDYWRVGTAGVIAGIGADDNLEIGDVVFATAAAAAAAADFTAVQANMSLGADLAMVAEATVATLPAATATAIPLSGLTEVYSIEVYNAANERIQVCVEGPKTAPTIEASEALTSLTVRMVGK